MTKVRIFIVLISVGVILVLFSLPKVVVDNDQQESAQELDESHEDEGEVSPNDHSIPATQEQQESITKLREKTSTLENTNSFTNFADSLISLYVELQRFDSAAYYASLIAERNPDVKSWEKTGDLYYEAFSLSQNVSASRSMAQKARSYYDKILEVEPNRTDIETKVALTLVSSQNPMQGVVLLREVVEKDPDNEEALFQLGVLSMQSGQYDKAVLRFGELIKLDSTDVQAWFYSGVAHFESGNKQAAKEYFETVLTLESDEEVIATVQSYLDRVK